MEKGRDIRKTLQVSSRAKRGICFGTGEKKQIPRFARDDILGPRLIPEFDRPARRYVYLEQTNPTSPPPGPMLSDIRSAARGLARAPVVAVSDVLCLGLVAGFAATLLPARQATRVNPIIAIQAE